MRCRFNAFLPATALLFFGCTTSQKPIVSTKPAQPAPAAQAPALAPAEPSPVAIETPVAASPAEETSTPDTYALHHHVFPDLFFKTDGQFFASLHAGEFERLHQIIAEKYGQAYSKAMRMKSVSQPDIVFITFAEPARPPLCYHIALVRLGETYLYLTLEKSEDILSTGVKSAFCGWTADGNHLNYGARKYTSLNEFEEEVRTFLAKQGELEPTAITTPR